jgi:hypothetical protein
LGIQFVKASIHLKLGPLHLVGSTHDEAASLAASKKSRHSWKPPL